MSQSTDQQPKIDQYELCRSLIDRSRYPIDVPDDAHLADVVSQVRKELAEDGCAVLHGFLSQNGLTKLLGECRGAAFTYVFFTIYQN